MTKVSTQSSAIRSYQSMPSLLNRLSLLKSVFALMQAVREVYEVVPAREWSETQSRMNKIVFIGIISNMLVNHPLLLSYKSVLNLSMPILLQAVIWISVSSKIHLVAASTDYRMICTSSCKSFIFVLRFDDSCSRFLFWGTPCKRVWFCCLRLLRCLSS